MSDRRQEIYNACLELARSDIKDEPERKCHPGHWSAVGVRAAQGDDPNIAAVGGVKVLVEQAYGDACKEAGRLSEVAVYSPWYPSRDSWWARFAARVGRLKGGER